MWLSLSLIYSLVRSKSEKENVGEICAEKGQLESGSQTNEC